MKKVLIALGAFVLFAAPAFAGEVEMFASWWDTDDAGDVFGGGLGYNWALNEALGFGVRASYFEELNGDPIENLLDADTPFEPGIKVLPLEANLRFNFARESDFWNPYLGFGVDYFMLDTDTGNIDDETGFTAVFGSSFGDGEGADLLVELQHRWVEGTVTDLDPSEFDFEGDNDEIGVDLDGFAVNLGVVWHW